MWGARAGPTPNRRREGKGPEHRGGQLCLPRQEMGEAQLEIITQTFCAAEEMSSDSTKLLVSCLHGASRACPGVRRKGEGGCPREVLVQCAPQPEGVQDTPGARGEAGQRSR